MTGSLTRQVDFRSTEARPSDLNLYYLSLHTETRIRMQQFEVLLFLALMAPARCQASCGNHLCSGFAWYPTAVANSFGAVFNVPALPTNASAYLDLTYYIYFNIFFHNYEPAGAIFNQFVPQLMLGQALSNSTGPPNYDAVWGNYSSYVFSAQYFFEIINESNVSVPKAVAGDVYQCVPGESLWTQFTQSHDHVWTLTMGVVGDPTRTSVVVAPRPFMGLVSGTSSWSEATYDEVHVNSCWELYDASPWDRAHWPGSGSIFNMQIDTQIPGGIAWVTNWTNGDAMNCSGHPNTTIAEKHSPTQQNVTWELVYGPVAKVDE